MEEPLLRESPKLIAFRKGMVTKTCGARKKAQKMSSVDCQQLLYKISADNLSVMCGVYTV